MWAKELLEQETGSVLITSGIICLFCSAAFEEHMVAFPVMVVMASCLILLARDRIVLSTVLEVSGYGYEIRRWGTGGSWVVARDGYVEVGDSIVAIAANIRALEAPKQALPEG